MVGGFHRTDRVKKTEPDVGQVFACPTPCFSGPLDLLVREHEKHPDNPYMFPSPATGEMYYSDSVVKLHEKILKDAGLEHIRFHDLRHTFATLALQNGVDIKTVSSMLGHYDAGFTLRTCTHATRQMQDQAAETMGSFMAQEMQKQTQPTQKHWAGGQTSCPVLSEPFRTFPRVDQVVGQALCIGLLKIKLALRHTEHKIVLQPVALDGAMLYRLNTVRR